MTPDHLTLLTAIRDLAATRMELAANTRKPDQILSAFPAGDIDGHRRYHESVIEWRELRNKLNIMYLTCRNSSLTRVA